MSDELRRWAQDLTAAYQEIALVLVSQPAADAGAPAAEAPVGICLVMHDGEKVPWFAAGKGINGMTYATIPGKQMQEQLLAEARCQQPGIQLYVNFCDARAMMYTYQDGVPRLAGDDILSCRWRLLFPDRNCLPPLDDFFYLWEVDTGGAECGTPQGREP